MGQTPPQKPSWTPRNTHVSKKAVGRWGRAGLLQSQQTTEQDTNATRGPRRLWDCPKGTQASGAKDIMECIWRRPVHRSMDRIIVNFSGVTMTLWLCGRMSCSWDMHTEVHLQGNGWRCGTPQRVSVLACGYAGAYVCACTWMCGYGYMHTWLSVCVDCMWIMCANRRACVNVCMGMYMCTHGYASRMCADMYTHGGACILVCAHTWIPVCMDMCVCGYGWRERERLGKMWQVFACELNGRCV